MRLTKSSSGLLVSTCLLFVLLHFHGQCNAELTPPYFNLAEGRKIYASSTCGVDSDGPELYCKLVGSDIETNINGTVINGQVRWTLNFSRTFEWKRKFVLPTSRIDIFCPLERYERDRWPMRGNVISPDINIFHDFTAWNIFNVDKRILVKIFEFFHRSI